MFARVCVRASVCVLRCACGRARAFKSAHLDAAQQDNKLTELPNINMPFLSVLNLNSPSLIPSAALCAAYMRGKAFGLAGVQAASDAWPHAPRRWA